MNYRIESARRALLALGVVAAFAVLMPVSASAFGISNYALNPSSTQAAGHPNVTFSFQRTGTQSEDLRDIRIDLPPGLLANPESANPKCTDSQFNLDQCPANSRVGTLAYKYTVSGMFDVNVPGNFYMLEPGATDVATVGFVLRPPRYCIVIFCAVPQKIFQKTSFKLQNFGNPNLSIQNQDAQRSVTTTLPLLFVSPSFNSEVTVKSVKITAQARSGAAQNGPYFMANTSSCAPAASTATITSYQDVAASAPSSFTPTGCEQVPFDPTIEFAPQDTSGGGTSGVVFTLNVPTADAPIQNAAPKSLDITFPAGSAPDFTKLAEWATKPHCAEADLQANTCPSASAVGLSAAISNFLPPNLVGGVYITGPVGLSIPLGVRLVGPRGTAIIVRLTLGIRTGANGATEVYATFDNGPQMPYSKFILGLLPLYINPQQCGPATTSVKATGWNGSVVTRTASYNVTACKPPNTTITSGPPSTTTNASPTWTFTSSIAGATFRCKIDSQPESACNSGTFTPSAPLPIGEHTFSVYAINGTAPDATPATQTFNVAADTPSLTATFTPSTLQAAAHPDLTVDVDFGPGMQVGGMTLDLPSGLQASLNAAPLCQVLDASLGSCPVASKIGTTQVSALVGGSAVSGTGDVFLTEAPGGDEAGGLAIEVPLGANTLIVQGGQVAINNTNAQQLQLRDIPQTLGGASLAFRHITMTLSGAPGLLTNASSCSTPSQFTLSLTDGAGTAAPPLTGPYQSTGCGSVPFNPTVTQSFPAPLQAGALTGTVVQVDLPLGNGTLKHLQVLQPPALAPNFPAFGAAEDQCPNEAAPSPDAIFDYTLCPSSAIVGVMTIDTPLLPNPMYGDIYLVSSSPIPWFGVHFRQPGIELNLIGATGTPQVDPACNPFTAPGGFCQTQISVTFTNLPDTPLTGTTFDITAPDRMVSTGMISSKLLRVASVGSSNCQPTVQMRWNATSHTGATASGSQGGIPISGC